VIGLGGVSGCHFRLARHAGDDVDQIRLVHAAFARLHRDTHPDQIDELVVALQAASGQPDQLQAPGSTATASAAPHRSAVFRGAGLGDALAEAVHEVEFEAG